MLPERIPNMIESVAQASTGAKTGPVAVPQPETARQGTAMNGRRYRLLMVSSHPVQYTSPLCRLMAQHPRLDVQVAYCSSGGTWDPEFGLQLVWDIPLTNGYEWVGVPNWSTRPGLGRFFGLVNFGLWKLITEGNFDAVGVAGYAYFSYWVAFLAAKKAKIPIMIGTDATQWRHPSGGWWWKRWLKPPTVRYIYRRLADVVMVASTAGRKFMQSMGVPDSRITFAPFVADNEYFAEHATAAKREELRRNMKIPQDAYVVLFCGKLVPWKRPADLLRAFAAVIHSSPQVPPNAYLLLAGEGALRGKLEALAKLLQVSERVRFMGFINQSKLPEVYAASDLLVLPSEHEAWGVVVNEAMSTGIPAVVSDRVGARHDLVKPGETGEIYPTGDIYALGRILRKLILDRELSKRLGKQAQARMASWTYRENLEGWLQGLEKVVD